MTRGMDCTAATPVHRHAMRSGLPKALVDLVLLRVFDDTERAALAWGRDGDPGC